MIINSNQHFHELYHIGLFCHAFDQGKERHAQAYGRNSHTRCLNFDQVDVSKLTGSGNIPVRNPRMFIQCHQWATDWCLLSVNSLVIGKILCLAKMRIPNSKIAMDSQDGRPRSCLEQEGPKSES